MTCISSEHGIAYTLQKASDRDQQVPHREQVPHKCAPATTVTGKERMLPGVSSGTQLLSLTLPSHRDQTQGAGNDGVD